MRRDRVTLFQSHWLKDQSLRLCDKLNKRWLVYVDRHEPPPQKLIRVAVRAMTRYQRRFHLMLALRREKAQLDRMRAKSKEFGGSQE